VGYGGVSASKRDVKATLKTVKKIGKPKPKPKKKSKK
jgi:hypothetical protein